MADAIPPPPHEHLRNPATRHALRIQSTLLDGAREYLSGQDFVELLPPIIGPVTDPGGRGAKQADVDYYGHPYKLMTSAILYKQAALLAFDKIFYIAPNVRLEPMTTAGTDRHLAEFHQIDVEAAGASRDEALGLVEGLLRHAVGRVVAELPEPLAALGRDPSALLDALEQPFEQLSHAKAVGLLHGLGHDQSPDSEINWSGEALLSREAHRPFFVTDYPKGSRGFYDRESATEPGLLRNFDLIAPEGFGELCSGGERESSYPRIIARMRETGENPAKYGWYLDAVRQGIPPSAGFGIGVQRLLRYVTGLAAVWQVSAYPKLPGMASP